MVIRPEALAEFKKLYLKEYKVELTDQQAQDQSSRLIQFVRTVYGDNPPRAENKQLTKKDKKLDNQTVLKLVSRAF